MTALNGNNMTIRVHEKSLKGDDPPAWLGRGSVFVSVDDIERHGHLFRMFYGFEKECTKRCLLRLRENNALPRIRSGPVFVRRNRS